MWVDHFLFAKNGWVPNNPRLPVIIYHGVMAEEGDLADWFEARFAANGWQGIWRNGIYDYHHYHTMAHEVLGVAQGYATVVLGGPGEREFLVSKGDCLILPAGTGHCRLRASSDFLVIGAYPPGQNPDLRKDAPGETGLHYIDTLPLPDTDPLGGDALERFWVGSG